MGLFDIIVILVVMFMAYLGYKEGILCQLGKIGALVIALLAVNIFGTTLGNLIHSMSGLELGKSILVGDLLLFVVVFIVISMFAGGLKKMFQKIHLGWIDSVAGALFSILKTLLILSIAAWIVAVFAKETDFVQKISGSPCFKFLMDFIPNLFHLIK